MLNKDLYGKKGIYLFSSRVYSYTVQEKKVGGGKILVYEIKSRSDWMDKIVGIIFKDSHPSSFVSYW